MIRKINPLLLLLASCLVTQQALAAHQREDSVVICRAENHPTHTLMSKAVAKLYHHLGYDVVFNDYPNKRSIATAQAGKCLGEVGRVRTPGGFKGLVYTKYPIHYLTARAYSLSHHDIDSWDDLASLKVGAVRGEIYAQNALSGRKATFVKSYRELLSFLRAGRVDVVIGIEESMEAMGPTVEHLYASSPLLRAPMYHLLNEKYQDMLPEVNHALEEMQQH